MAVGFFLIVFILLINGYSFPWSWDKIPVWAFFGIDNTSLISDYEAQFVGTHYDVITLSACLGNPSITHISTEQAFYYVARQIRKYATNNTKILFYWNTGVCISQCYNITSTVMQNKSMWWYDDYGNPLFNGNNPSMPYYDLTQFYVREWWINSLSNIITAALNQGIIVDGVYADGMASLFGPNVSEARTQEYNNAVMSLMDEARAIFNEINIEYDTDLFVLGNGLVTYPFWPDHLLYAVPHTDALVVEHFAAWEEVNENGIVNATDLLIWYNVTQSIINGDYGKNKSIFINAWVGPETTPIMQMDQVGQKDIIMELHQLKV